jgi:hypothetical protein
MCIGMAVVRITDAGGKSIPSFDEVVFDTFNQAAKPVTVRTHQTCHAQKSILNIRSKSR